MIPYVAKIISVMAMQQLLLRYVTFKVFDIPKEANITETDISYPSFISELMINSNKFLFVFDDVHFCQIL